MKLGKEDDVARAQDKHARRRVHSSCGIVVRADSEGEEKSSIPVKGLRELIVKELPPRYVIDLVEVQVVEFSSSRV